MMKKTYADGGYSEAIPIDDLVQLAKEDVKKCNSHSEQVIRRCAAKVVRKKLCPCASSVDAIVDAVVDEYLRQLASLPANT